MCLSCRRTLDRIPLGVDISSKSWHLVDLTVWILEQCLIWSLPKKCPPLMCILIYPPLLNNVVCIITPEPSIIIQTMWCLHLLYVVMPKDYNDIMYQLSGLVVWVSALRLGDPGSNPGRVIPKTLKNGTQCLLLGTQHQGLGLGVSPC